MVKCYYCKKYKKESNMKKVIVGRNKDSINYVFSCGCYEKKLQRDTIDYLNNEGEIVTSSINTNHEERFINGIRIDKY